jgi:hypothetical protein
MPAASLVVLVALNDTPEDQEPMVDRVYPRRPGSDIRRRDGQAWAECLARDIEELGDD